MKSVMPPKGEPPNFDTMVFVDRQKERVVDVRLLFVEFSREFDDAEAPVIQAEPLF